MTKKSALTLIIGLLTVLSSFTAQAGVVRVPFTLSSGTNNVQSYNFGDVGLGQMVYATFNYKNTSAKDLTIKQTEVEGAAEIVSTDCKSALAAQATCQVVVGLSVADQGLNSGSIKFYTDQYTNPDIFNTTANGISAGTALTVEPASASFNYKAEEKTFKITNNRSYPIKIDSILPSQSYWSVSYNGCAIELNAGASCDVNVKYVSTKTGSYTGVLKLLSQSVLVGQATLNGSLEYGVPAFSVNAINLPSLMVGNTYKGSLTLTNIGKGPLSISESFFENTSNALSFESEQCSGKLLAYNESCSVSYKLLFNTPGIVQNGIAFRFSNSTTSYSSVGFFASAISSNPILTATPTTLNYGINAAGSSKTMQVTLQSIGNSAVTVKNISLSGNSLKDFSILNKSSCIGDLTEGNQCVLNIQYTAPATTSSVSSSATLVVDSNSSSAVSNVALQGVSATPLLTLTPDTQTISGQEGQSYFKSFQVINNSTVSANIEGVSLSNSAYTVDNSSCTLGKVLQPSESCLVQVNLQNAKAGTGSAILTVKHSGAKTLTGTINHNIAAAFANAKVGEVDCPTVSAATSAAQTIVAGSAYACSLVVENPGNTPLYLPNSAITFSSNTGSFAAVPETKPISGTLTGFTISPQSSVKVYFTHTVPTNATLLTASASLKIFGTPGNESTATSYSRDLSANVVAPAFSLSDIVCPASVYTTQSITCSANLYNKSLTPFSTLIGGKNVIASGNQIAAKFSETTVNATPIANLVVLKPTTDTMPSPVLGTNPGFNWNVSAPYSCSQGSSATNIVPGGKCAVNIVFNPTVVGDYVVPLWGVNTNDISKWVRSDSNAVFTVKKTVLDLIATPFECNAVYPNAVGTCTTKLTNATPVGINNSFAVPSITVSGDASSIIEKTGTAIKTTHTCGASIAPGVTCSYTVTFKGATPGNYASKATLTSNGQTDTVDLNPIILAPDISLSPFVCPAVFAGDSSSCTATLTNSMTSAITVSTLTSSAAGFSTPTISTKTLAANATATVTVPFVLNTPGAFSNTVTISTSVGNVSGVANVNVKALPASNADTVSDIICPDVSAGWSAPYTVAPSSNLACYAVVKNTTSAPMYVPNTGVSRVSDNGSFAYLGATLNMTGSTTAGYVVPANSSIKLYFGHSSPTTPGQVSATFNIKVYTKVGLEASATLFTKTAVANIVPMNVTVENVICSSAMITQDVKCSATIFNKSLTAQSIFTPGTNVATNTVQLAAKFSGVTVSNVLLSSKATAPTKDYLPTALNGLAPSFNWTLPNAPQCSTGSSATSGIVPGGRCNVSITFKPTVAGQYSVPLAAVSNVDASKWPTAMANFEVKSVVLDLVASPFECIAVYPNTTGTCTTTVTNFTPAGVLNTYPTPTIIVTGDANTVISKNANGSAKTTTNCAGGIAPGASCKIVVNFSSATPGKFSGKATLTSNGQTDEVDIIPVVNTPDISLSSFICPAAAVGDAGECTAQFTNAMTVSVTVNTLTQQGSTGFQTPTMAIKTVPAGQSSVVRLPFKFLSSGNFNSTVTLNTTYGNVSAPASINSQEYPQASGSLTPFTCPTLNWGTPGQCTATLSNNSTQRALAITSITKTVNAAFGNITHTCSTSVAPSGTCVITIPVGVVNAGTYSTDVTVKTTPVLTKPAVVVVNPPIISTISPAAAKASVNTVVQQTSLFKNESSFSIPLQASNMTLTGTGFSIVSNTCTGTLAAGATCTLVTSIKQIAAGNYNGKATLSAGGVSATSNLTVITVVPKLNVSLAYADGSVNVGLKSNSGNWYRVTNDSPNAVTLSKFTPVAQTLLYMDMNQAGQCGVGKVLAPDESCLFMEGNNVASVVSAPHKFLTSSTVTASSGLSGSWIPMYKTYQGLVERASDVSMFAMANTPVSGSVRVTNQTSGALTALAFEKATGSMAGGDIVFDSGSCGGDIPAGGSCIQNFKFTKTASTGPLTIGVKGKYARLINNVQQGWGDVTPLGSVSFNVSFVSPSGLVTAGRYNPQTQNGSTSDATSIFKNTSKVPYTVTNLTFTNGLDQQFVSTDCIGVRLNPGQTCSVITRFTPWKNRGESDWTPGLITVTIENGDQFTGYVKVFRLPWDGGPDDSGSGQTTGENQLKTCIFATSQTIYSRPSCGGISIANNPPERYVGYCTSGFSSREWLAQLFMDGWPIYETLTDSNMYGYKGYQFESSYKLSGPGTPLPPYLKEISQGSTVVWKNSGMPVTPVVKPLQANSPIKAEYYVYPKVQIKVNYKGVAGWTDVYNAQFIESSIIHTPLARNRIANIMNRVSSFFNQDYYLTSDVNTWHQVINSIDDRLGSRYQMFVSKGYDVRGAEARQAWEENTPGPNCHMPGTVRVKIANKDYQLYDK